MRTCEDCGFENAEEGKACALCGASGLTPSAPDSGLETLALSPSRSSGVPPAGSLLGQVFGGRYRLEAELGRGGMGRVFRVTDLQDGTARALKLLHAAEQEEEGGAERFKREIAVLGRLHHPAIPRVFGWGAHEGQLYFVSELVDGVDLKLEIRRRGPWPVAEACALAATLADALAAAHAQGIVHRDVKPNNVMIASDGAVRLLDFGLARGLNGDITTLTRTGMIVGTPGYMSPEQFDGTGVDERTDVYSLGVVLFELVTGRLPFSAPTPIAVALKHKGEPPPPPRVLRPDLPVWLDRLVLRCLEKDPARRVHGAAELAAELRRPRAGRPQLRRLASGDAVLEDDGQETAWALTLVSARPKTGWSEGMALAYAERFYKLAAVEEPAGESGRWTYRFDCWPEGQIFRRLVDYDEDCRRRREEAQPRGLGDKLSRWLGRKE